MDHFEMVEKLRTKANVTYEEAKAALEASDWDILDALVLLESEGKVKAAPEAQEYSTQEKKEFTWETRGGSEMRLTVSSALTKLWDWIKALIKKGNKNQFVITRQNNKLPGHPVEELIAFPITVLVLLILVPGVGLPTILIALVIGLFLGARYSFRGPDINNRVNEFMDKAQDKAASAVEIHMDINGKQAEGNEIHADENESKVE